jgi:hypothetical protein
LGVDSALLLALIYPGTWKWNSQKLNFVITEF